MPAMRPPDAWLSEQFISDELLIFALKTAMLKIRQRGHDNAACHVHAAPPTMPPFTQRYSLKECSSRCSSDITANADISFSSLRLPQFHACRCHATVILPSMSIGTQSISDTYCVRLHTAAATPSLPPSARLYFHLRWHTPAASAGPHTPPSAAAAHEPPQPYFYWLLEARASDSRFFTMFRHIRAP